jgi:hypothetical protein
MHLLLLKEERKKRKGNLLDFIGLITIERSRIIKDICLLGVGIGRSISYSLAAVASYAYYCVPKKKG